MMKTQGGLPQEPGAKDSGETVSTINIMSAVRAEISVTDRQVARDTGFPFQISLLTIDHVQEVMS